MSDSIVLGGGCFWCTEAIYKQVRGVSQVIPGYAGGTLKNPTYHSHENHAEVIKVVYDSEIITLDQILLIFFQIHDPTTKNKQGHDIGTQYRSIILVSSNKEEEIAKHQLKEVQKSWPNPIVTEIKKLDIFYDAETYHQDYFQKNKANPYCQVVIAPKIEKFKSKFNDYLV